MSVFSRNIAAKLARDVFFLALVLGALLSAPGVFGDCRRERALAAQNLSRDVRDFAPLAAKAALSGNPDLGGEIIAAFARSHPVFSVEIRDAGGTVIAKRDAPASGFWDGLGLSYFGQPNERVSLFQGEGRKPVGTLHVVANAAWLDSGLWTPLLWALGQSLVLAAFLAAFCFGLLRRNLSEPLREAAVTIGALDPETPEAREPLVFGMAAGHEEDELGAVVQAAGALAAKASLGVGRREAALCEAQASRINLQTMIDASSDFIFLKDDALCYVVANKAHEAALGLPVAQIIGKTDFDLMPDNEALNCFKSDRRAFEQGSVDVDECVGGRHYHVVKERVEDANGQAIGVAGVIRDVTESRKLEKLRGEKRAAEAAGMAARDFVARMSHEIRTPLSSLLGAAELLSDSGLTPAQRDLAARMEFSGGLLMEIVGDVLELSAVEGAPVSVESRIFRLDALMESVVRSFDARIRAGELELSVAASGMMRERRMGDPLRLRRALVNLIGAEAVRDGGGRVDLRVDRGEGPDLVVFTIASGSRQQGGATAGADGEPDAMRPAPGVRGFEEGGLGLSIARKLVEAMDGEIRFTGELGAGSEFRVVLPLPEAPDEPVSPEASVSAGDNAGDAAGDAMAPAGTPSPARQTRSLAGLRLLIVEDFQPNSAILESFLEGSGVIADVAEDGREAVARFSRKQYDLIFMDIEMPEMDGYEATRRIRAIEREKGLAPLPIVALTAHAFAHNKAQCMDAGCTEFFAKPIRKARFLEILEKYAPKDLETRTRKAGAATSGEWRMVKPGLEQLLPIFIESVNKYLGQAEVALTAGDYEEIRRIGHTLKGSAGTYGAEDLWDMASDLEHAGEAGDAPSARDSLASMRDFMEMRGFSEEELRRS